MGKRRWYERSAAMLLTALLVVNSEGIGLAAGVQELPAGLELQQWMDGEAESESESVTASPSDAVREEEIKKTASDAEKNGETVIKDSQPLKTELQNVARAAVTSGSYTISQSGDCFTVEGGNLTDGTITDGLDAAFEAIMGDIAEDASIEIKMAQVDWDMRPKITKNCTITVRGSYTTSDYAFELQDGASVTINNYADVTCDDLLKYSDSENIDFVQCAGTLTCKYGIPLADNCNVKITGGTIKGKLSGNGGHGIFEMTGGTLEGFIKGAKEINISGGTVKQEEKKEGRNVCAIDMAGNSTLTISGGSISAKNTGTEEESAAFAIKAEENSKIKLSGLVDVSASATPSNESASILYYGATEFGTIEAADVTGFKNEFAIDVMEEAMAGISPSANWIEGTETNIDLIQKNTDFAVITDFYNRDPESAYANYKPVVRGRYIRMEDPNAPVSKIESGNITRAEIWQDISHVIGSGVAAPNGKYKVNYTVDSTDKSVNLSGISSPTEVISMVLGADTEPGCTLEIKGMVNGEEDNLAPVYGDISVDTGTDATIILIGSGSIGLRGCCTVTGTGTLENHIKIIGGIIGNTRSTIKLVEGYIENESAEDAEAAVIQLTYADLEIGDGMQIKDKSTNGVGAIAAYGPSNITITGGTIESRKGVGLTLSRLGSALKFATLNMTGGSITGGTYGISQAMSANPVIAGGEISGNTADILLYKDNDVYQGKMTLKGEVPFETMELRNESGMMIDFTEAYIGDNKTLTVTLPWDSEDVNRKYDLFTMKTSNYQQQIGKIQVKAKTDALTPILAVDHTVPPTKKSETTGVSVCSGRGLHPTLVQYYESWSAEQPFYEEYVLSGGYLGDVSVEGKEIKGWKAQDRGKVDLERTASAYSALATETAKLYASYAVSLQPVVSELTANQAVISGTSDAFNIFGTNQSGYTDGDLLVINANKYGPPNYMCSTVENGRYRFTISDLRPNTKYTYYFVAMNSNNDCSDVIPVTFTTSKLPIPSGSIRFTDLVTSNSAVYTGEEIGFDQMMRRLAWDSNVFRGLENISFRRKNSNGTYDETKLSGITDAGVYGVYVTTKDEDERYEHAEDLYVDDFTIKKSNLEHISDSQGNWNWYTLISSRKYDSEDSSFVQFQDTISGYGTVTEILYLDEERTEKAEKNKDGRYDAGTYYVSVKVSGGDNINPTVSPLPVGQVVIEKADNDVLNMNCADISYGETPHPTFTAKNMEGTVTFLYSEDLHGEYSEWNTANHIGEWYFMVSVGESKNYKAVRTVNTSASGRFQVDKMKVVPYIRYLEGKYYDTGTWAHGELGLKAVGDSVIRPEDTEELRVYGDFEWTSKEAGTSTVNVKNIYMTSGWEDRYELTVRELTNVSWEGCSIKPADMFVKVTPSGSLTYTGKPQQASVSVSARTVDDSPVTFTYSTDGVNYQPEVPRFTDAGIHTVYFRASAPNHKTQEDKFEVTITPLNLQNVSVIQAGSLTYTGKPQRASVLTKAETMTGSQVTFTFSTDEKAVQYQPEVPEFTNAGVYTVYYRAEAAGHDAETGSFTVTIDSAELEITAVGAEVIYGSPLLESDCKSTFTGFVNNETTDILDGTLTYTSTYTVGNDVGEYTILPGGLTAKNGNYRIRYMPGKLTVVQKEAAISLNNADELSHMYNGQVVEAATDTDSDGSVSIVYRKGSEVLTGAPKDAGNYTVTVNIGEGKNYKAGSADFSFEITKAPLNVIAEDRTITAGDGEPEYAVQYEGFVGSDTENSLQGNLSVVTDCADMKLAGTYSIIPSGLSSQNYDITYVNGTLTIERRRYSDSSDDADESQTSSSNPPSKDSGSSGSWKNDGRGWWYRRADGTYLAGTREKHADGSVHEYVSWAFINNKWWAFNADGYMTTGWTYDERTKIWYYIDENSGMKTGWYYDKDGKWYHLDPETGAMAVGWKYIDGYWYLFDPNGQMYADTMTPDGYRVDRDGRWI